MEEFRLQNAVIGKLQMLLSQASDISLNFSNIIASWDSLREDVTAAHQICPRDGPSLIPEGDVYVINRRNEFLNQLSKALAALQECEDMCSEIDSELNANKASHTVSRIIIALRANARAQTYLEALSHGPYSSCGIACSARAHYRVLLNNVCSHVKHAPSLCIKKSESPDILLENDFSVLQGLQDSLLEYAPEYAHVLVDAVADDLAALFTDEVFSSSVRITQEATSAGFFLRSSSFKPSADSGNRHGLCAFADSLSCVASALRSSMPCSNASAEHSLSNAITSALLRLVGQKLCTFAANSADDFSQAQKWSEALRQLPPRAVGCSEPTATFWELWVDRRSVDAVNAAQQQLLQMNTCSHLRLCRNAKECVSIVFQSSVTFNSLCRYLSSLSESLRSTTDVCWHDIDLDIPDLLGTVCMLDISQLVLSMGSELALSVGCKAPWESLVMKKLSRAICTVSRIALVARVVSPALATANSAQPHNDLDEAHLVCSDMQVLSVALSRAAVQLSSRMASAACPQSRAIVQEFCLLSRTASMKARQVSAQVCRR